MGNIQAGKFNTNNLAVLLEGGIPMKRMRRLFAGILLVMALVMTLIPNVAMAASNNSLDALVKQIQAGKTNDITLTNDDLYLNYVSSEDGVIKTYDKDGGGYYLYMDMVSSEYEARTGYVSQERFNELTAGARRELLSDIMRLCNHLVAYHAKQNNTEEEGDRITDQTANLYIESLQNLDGAGSQLISSLMADTKPDYVSANRIYQPFSGVVGTILGIISILIMALLGITMANDIAYIVIPIYQLALDGDSDASQGGGTKGMAKIVSQEARNAVKAAGNGDGANGQSGSGNKLAIGVYFKARWKSLVILGICLLYLVQGQIYSFVAWILDLLSGFLNF